MIISILGRQPAISMAELEQLYGSANTRWFSDTSAIVESDSFDIERVGGSQKAGCVVFELRGNWMQTSRKIVDHYLHALAHKEAKITLGISTYGFDVSPRDVQKTGLILKSKLRERGVSLRLVPNSDPALNTATSHHNKLGLSEHKIELLVVRSRSGTVIVAESVGAQNITALAARDQQRPKRDAFVGMLPPKLARIMVNLAAGQTYRPVPSAQNHTRHAPLLLDPFCGTGVILQEALLLGYDVYATDLSEKMVSYTIDNLTWLLPQLGTDDMTEPLIATEIGDATNYQWQHTPDLVACEAYLGQPFSAPPSPAKLTEVRGNCDHIISSFLRNLAQQIPSGTPLCVAVPAWRAADGSFTHLPLIHQLDSLGYTEVQLQHIRSDQLLYYREDQVVARELLVMSRT